MTTPPTLLITRPVAQSQRFAAQCQGALGAEAKIVISPVMQIAYRPASDLGGVVGVIFTSENGVRAVWDQARAIPAYCVGERTAAAAAQAGFVARVAGGTAVQLLAMIRQTGPTGQLLHLRGAHQSGDISADLRASGIRAKDEIVYDQIEQRLTKEALDLLRGPAPVYVPLFSARSARLLLEQSGPLAESVHVIAISANVAAICAGHTDSLSIAKTPDADGMLAEITRLMVV